jgi:DNA-binding transcriptional MerR regulator
MVEESFNPPIIQDKFYFKIGEVAKILGLEPYVLRYWETEFPEIAPSKSKSRQRLYKRQDVELILQIQTLLYKQNFTIKGARKKINDLKRNKTQPDQQTALDFKEEPGKVRQHGDEIRSLIAEMNSFLAS